MLSLNDKVITVFKTVSEFMQYYCMFYSALFKYINTKTHLNSSYNFAKIDSLPIST